MTVLTALERNDNCKKFYSIGLMLKVIYLLFRALELITVMDLCFVYMLLNCIPYRDRANILRLECIKAFSSIRQRKD